MRTFGERRSAAGSTVLDEGDVGWLGEASGSPGRSPGRFVTSRGSSGCEDRAEVDSGGRVHRRGALGGNGEEGVDAARESGNGVAVLHALLGGVDASSFQYMFHELALLTWPGPLFQKQKSLPASSIESRGL